MDKEMLFRFMRSRFREAGFTPDEIDLHIANFNERYQNHTDEEVEADLMRRGGPSRMVARIIEQRNSVFMKDAEYRAFVEGQETAPIDTENNSAESQTVSPDSTSAEPVQAETAQTDEDVRMYIPKSANDSPKTETIDNDPLNAWFANDTPQPNSVKDEDVLSLVFRSTDKTTPQNDTDAVQKPNAPAAHPKQQPDTAPSVSAVHTIPLFEDAPIPRPQNQPIGPFVSESDPDMSKTKVMHVATAEQRAIHAQPQNRPHPKNAGNPRTQQKEFFAPEAVTDAFNRQNTAPITARQTKKQLPAFLRLPDITYWGEGTEEGVRRFRILFALSLPFVIVLIAALALLLVGIAAAIAAMIIFLVLVLVVEVALGSILSLIGMIYGISQLFLVLPIGMFELGLGIVCVGITMLCGILIYNLAVRLLPFLLKKLFQFAGFMRRYIQDLYYYVKGECYRR